MKLLNGQPFPVVSSLRLISMILSLFMDVVQLIRNAIWMTQKLLGALMLRNLKILKVLNCHLLFHLTNRYNGLIWPSKDLLFGWEMLGFLTSESSMEWLIMILNQGISWSLKLRISTMLNHLKAQKHLCYQMPTFWEAKT